MTQNVNIAYVDPSRLMKKRLKILFDHAYELTCLEFKREPTIDVFARTMDVFCDLLEADIDALAKTECEIALKRWQLKETGENISPGINRLNEAIKKRFKDGI